MTPFQPQIPVLQEVTSETHKILPNETDEPVYHYLHTITRNDAETAAQVYSEWIPRAEQIDVSVHASRK